MTNVRLERLVVDAMESFRIHCKPVQYRKRVAGLFNIEQGTLLLAIWSILAARGQLPLSLPSFVEIYDTLKTVEEICEYNVDQNVMR
jgi:hypothetical protein